MNLLEKRDILNARYKRILMRGRKGNAGVLRKIKREIDKLNKELYKNHYVYYCPADAYTMVDVMKALRKNAEKAAEKFNNDMQKLSCSVLSMMETAARDLRMLAEKAQLPELGKATEKAFTDITANLTKTRDGKLHHIPMSLSLTPAPSSARNLLKHDIPPMSMEIIKSRKR